MVGGFMTIVGGFMTMVGGLTTIRTLVMLTSNLICTIMYMNAPLISSFRWKPYTPQKLLHIFSKSSKFWANQLMDWLSVPDSVWTQIWDSHTPWPVKMRKRWHAVLQLLFPDYVWYFILILHGQWRWEKDGMQYYNTVSRLRLVFHTHTPWPVKMRKRWHAVLQYCFRTMPGIAWGRIAGVLYMAPRGTHSPRDNQAVSTWWTTCKFSPIIAHTYTNLPVSHTKWCTNHVIYNAHL